jgi:pectin methylesterase-like acyl-CoA thioesterase
MFAKRKTCVQTLILALLISLMLGVQSVKSSPKTIVVPDDYTSITTALNNAAEGDTIFVKKGTYEEETLEINKTVSLLGEEVNSTIISLHPQSYQLDTITPMLHPNTIMTIR